MSEELHGRDQGHELRTVIVVDDKGDTIREQLGFAGLQIGERIRIIDVPGYNLIDSNTVWLVESKPEPVMTGKWIGVLGCLCTPIKD